MHGCSRRTWESPSLCVSAFPHSRNDDGVLDTEERTFDPSEASSPEGTRRRADRQTDREQQCSKCSVGTSVNCCVSTKS